MRICPRCSELFPDDATFCAFDAVELTKATDPFLGRTIAGRFRLIKKLGAGGMSTVYLARHVMIDRLSAIKILRPDFALNPHHRERFLREARAVNRINHRNIVEITDFGETGELAYLVMEFVEGESLLEHVQRGRLPWERASRIGAQISSALARAHQMNVIHRDLKPENVMLVQLPDLPDLVKLTDFGIAKILDAPAITFTEQMFGTPGYIAPEYLEGKAADARADLYALGVVLYEMVSGVLPYDARGQSEKLLKPLTAAPIPLTERMEGLPPVPPEYEALTLRLLAKSPEDRPQDAFAVQDTLADLLRRRAGATGPSLLPPRGAPPSPVFVPAPVPRPASSAPVTPAVATPQAAVDPTAATPFGNVPIASPVGRDASPTIADEPPPPPTAQLGGNDAAALSSRWAAALAALDVSIARALSAGGERAKRAERAQASADRVRELVRSVDRGTRKVAEYQAKVDRLAAEGREFRANLGRAIDELSHDRSRERVHQAALAAAAHPSSPPASMASTTALDGARRQASAVEQDLTFQIDELQRQLDQKNANLDEEFTEATALLEGAIGAVRRMTHELVKTLDEASTIVMGK